MLNEVGGIGERPCGQGDGTGFFKGGDDVECNKRLILDNENRATSETRPCTQFFLATGLEQ